jgi:DNA modification methylase
MRDLLNKVTQGDCLEVMREIPDKSVDMILCDLPYGTTQNSWDSEIPLDCLWEQYKRIIKDNRPILLTAQTPFDKVLGASNLPMLRYEWLWIKDTPTGHLNAKRMPMKKHENILVFYEDLNKAKTKKTDDHQFLRRYFLEELSRTGLSRREIKDILGNDMASHYFTEKSQWSLPTLDNYKKLQSTGYFVKEYSYLKQIYTNEKVRINSEMRDNFTYNPQGLIKKEVATTRKGRNGNGSNYGKSDKDAVQEYTGYPNDVLYFNREVGFHPTQKPVALFEYLIKTYTNEGEVILDNCIGSGTTAVAAINTGRQFIGIEREPEYVEIANKRIAETLAKTRRRYRKRI